LEFYPPTDSSGFEQLLSGTPYSKLSRFSYWQPAFLLLPHHATQTALLPLLFYLFQHEATTALSTRLDSSHAHPTDRSCVHRDIKPSNILITGDGKLKLADFGISKLKSYLQPSVTLREFVSRPFTPPEEDDGSYTYTRDVFSFGVLVLKCLTNVELVNYDNIRNAIAAFQAPEPIIDIIERSVSLDPAERPANAEVLLAQLQAIQGKQAKDEQTKKSACYLNLTTKCLYQLQKDLGIDSQVETENTILRDLNDECGSGIRPYKFKDKAPDEPDREDHYEIYGVSYRYHAKVDEHRRNCLIVFNAWSSFPSLLEQRRERAWTLPYEFKIGRPLNESEAREVIKV